MTTFNAQELALSLFSTFAAQAGSKVYALSDDAEFFKSDRVKDAKVRARILMERAIIRQAVTDILAGGYLVTVDYGDGEYGVKKSSSQQAIMADVCACDEEWLRVWAPPTCASPKGEKRGAIYLVYGNDGWDVISDHSLGAVEALLTNANALADAFGELL